MQEVNKIIYYLLEYLDEFNDIEEPLKISSWETESVISIVTKCKNNAKNSEKYS